MSRVVYGNPPDFNEMLCWQRLLSPGDVFVDVGANVGVYSVWAAAHGANVVAVEPNPHAVARLQANAILNGFHFDIHPKALAASSGTQAFSTCGDVLGHLSDVGDVEVETITLDELLDGRRARGVKIDVEGYERLVLEGACRSLSAGRIDYIQLEWNDTSLSLIGEDRSGVAAILASHQYALAKPNETGTLERVTSADMTHSHDLFACRPGLWP
ncbi:MAG: FkbM family methyltransferase [Actinomycetota bacterium]